MVTARHLAHTRATQGPDLFGPHNLHRRNHEFAFIVATIADQQRIKEVAVRRMSESSKLNCNVQDCDLFELRC